ncbi:MAG: hypothetical protein WCO54_06025 [Bacteroidota bacterium]
MRKLLTCLFALILCNVVLNAQQINNTRTKIITAVSDTLHLDSSVIFKGSVSVSDDEKGYIENKDYVIDYVHSAIIFTNIPSGKKLKIFYQVLLLDIAKPYVHKDSRMRQQEFIEIKNPFLYTPGGINTNDIFKNDGLKMNGSLSRGLAFGNNQNVVLNSNLNLQLAGKINNDIDVIAAISDENNPIQPEGNTQQLQDFDKVFIQLSKKNTKLVVGDFEMARPANSYFLNYFKKSRGGQINTLINTGKNTALHVGADVAISRGRFARNVINGIEGNQGPYRLNGSNGETYIILISGTETVYLDGEKMIRGEQNDYVIDYNSGDITFMAKHVITQYSRIVIEFQYSDKNFSRSIYHLNTEFEQKNYYRLRANYFLEQDNKSQPLLQNLTDSDKAILASVGNNIDQALSPSAIKTNVFSKSKILYRKIDSVNVSIVYPGIYVYTNDPNSDSVFYELKFSNVGAGKGNYILSQTAANGRVFQWVAPSASGAKQGDYEPVTLLVSPKRMQMLSLGADIFAIKNTTLTIEIARSDYDKNLFSDLDKTNNGGYGVKVGGTNMIPLENKALNFWNIKTDASYEFVDKNFRYVERYRNVEFDRTWNRQLNNQTVQDTGFTENILSAKTSLNKNSVGNVYYQVSYYDRASLFNGLQNFAGANLMFGKSMMNTEAEWISSTNKTTSITLNNDVSRYKVDLSRRVLNLISGVKYETEKSSFKRADDSLLNGSFFYNQMTVYTKTADSSKLKYKVDLTQREDFLPYNKDYRSVSVGRNFNSGIEWLQQNNNRLTGTFTYRDFEVRDTSYTKLKPERTILSRIEYDYRFFKKVFSANTYLQLGSGNELRKDYQYIEVPVGQGVYVWKDFNNNGKQELDEFVPASFIEKNQANYIKIVLPTTSTIRTNSNQFNQTLNINPSAIWNNKNGLLKFISRWNNQTGLRIDRKTTALNNLDFINPFVLNVLDSELISLSSSVRNTLFFNRTDPTFGFDINYQDNKSKVFQTNGFDSKHREEQGVNVRWNFTNTWGISSSFNYGIRGYFSDYFKDNNYYYSYRDFKPRLIYQVSQNFRATFLMSYFEGKNAYDFGNQFATNRELGGEIRYNISSTGVINAKYSSYTVSLSSKDGANISSPVVYDMLNGFTVGQNAVWNISLQQRLGSNLMVNLMYDGRKSEGTNIIHVGRMEARYIF